MALAWTEREVAAGTGPKALQGTLVVPNGVTPVPGVLILAGSGPVDRDGNLPGARNESLKLLAYGLAERGVASLRADKRGIGASRAAGWQEEELRFNSYVADAIAWLAVLRGEPRIARVSLLGHSEGALLATLAAQRTEVAGLVLVAGAGEPAGRVIERQLAATGVPEALQDASRRIIAALKAGRTVSDVPAELAPLFRPSVQPYLASWLSLDPAAELAQVRTPVLIVQGTTDLQIGMDDARRLAAARPGAELFLIEGMNHVLKRAPPDRAANLTTYADPSLPLAPELVATIGAFLDR
ncbi:alpha/beta hydrolase [Azospirillum thermophilum]|uniref:Alpha/beta hydrolase n=2 Tax=Azospirillum thermophilum TaxID=2202148 RepID=A0A2S2CW45_9PROT|nr:alpha/beta hydrolase [Azospirillum thermophilum]